MDKETIKIAAYIGSGILVGGLIGGFAVRDHFKLLYEQRLQEETESIRDAYQRLSKEGVYASPESAAEALIPVQERAGIQLTQFNQIVEDNSYGGVFVEGERYGAGGDEDAEGADEEVTTNSDAVKTIFDPQNLPPRDRSKPYVITAEEYYTDDSEKLMLAYYAEDRVLADEREKPIPDIEKVIGDAVEYFGVGSDDPMIVYVKNEQIGRVIEVVKDEQSFAKLVLKIQETQNRPTRRRFHPDED
jgi:hypothetical protein